MEQKLLLVGIIVAVVVLVLAGLNPVVSFNTAKSSYAKDSPLFRVRTNRATEQQSNRVDCEYVGKGKTTTIHLPARDNSKSKLTKIGAVIKEMDTIKFNRFIDLIINRVNHDDTFKNVNTNNVRNFLNQLRNNPQSLENYIFIERQNNGYPSTDYWEPGCYLLLFLYIISMMIAFTWAYISSSNPNLQFCQQT